MVAALALLLLVVASMQLSRFVLTYRDVRPDEHVLYDVISDHYVGVDGKTLDAVKSWRESPPTTADERDAEQLLTEEGFLVRDRAEDDRRLRSYLEGASEGMPGTFYITLMPTLACNLACNYCFQKNHPAFNRMTEAHEDATVEWILRKLDESKCPILAVHYFGGEPLTRKDYLLRTAEIFSSAMRARGGAFKWEITTNGIGLDGEFANKMTSFGPGSVKVTLDGDKETHDAVRVYRNGKGTFDEIFSNLIETGKACPALSLRLGGNFRPDDLASYERLLDRIVSAGLGDRFDMVRFKPVVDIDETGDVNAATCTTCASGGKTTETLVQLGRSVEKRIQSRKPFNEIDILGPCELHWKNSYIIDPDGRVYKCPAVAGRPEMAIGHVTEQGERNDPVARLRPWRMCGDCSFLPVCVGGCIASVYLQTGKVDEVMCEKQRFEATFQEAIVNRYLAEFSEPASHQAA